MSGLMTTSPAEGVKIPVTPFRPTAVVGAVGVPALLQMVHSPLREEDPKALRYLGGPTRRHARIRAQVQRPAKSTQKGRNVASYARYIASGMRGDNGSAWSTPPVTLWVPEDDIDGVLVEGTDTFGAASLTVRSGTVVVAIDGETQIAALHAINDDPAAYGLDLKSLHTARVPIELYWGLSVEDARQVFYDRNVMRVPVAKNLAMGMDHRDLGTKLTRTLANQLVVSHGGEKIRFARLVQARKRQLGRTDEEVVTLSALRAMVVTTLFGSAGVQLTSGNVTVDELPPGVSEEQASRAVVELLTQVLTDLFPHLAARSAAATPAVMAGIGVAAHQVMPWAQGEMLSADALRKLLSGVKWERRAAYWDGVAGRATGDGDRVTFGGGVKDSGARVAAALLNPQSPAGKKIRARG